MTITFIGHGYVGLVTACVFADLGNTVYVIGRSPQKIKRLSSGDPIIFEPGLAEILKKNLEAKRIFFTDSYTQSIEKSDVVFIAVGTPAQENGEADLTNVFKVAEAVAKNLKKGYTVVSCKSTVPVGTNRKIYEIIDKIKPGGADFDVASCPEFLREGSALHDTFYPDRIVIGVDNQRATNMLLRLHKPLSGKRVIVTLESAEIIKYASNALLATKISFANLISFLCEKTDADVEEVLEGVGLDSRIGRVFLHPGLGYGGSCFPKDVKALTKTGQSLGVDMSLLEAITSINHIARKNFLNKIYQNVTEKNVAIWGLSFKPNTDDIREAPSIYIIDRLIRANFKITVFDPAAIDNIRTIFGDKLNYADDPYMAVKGASALIILTEWNEFKQIDLKKVKQMMKGSVIIDGRNIYDPVIVKNFSFNYISVGRSAI